MNVSGLKKITTLMAVGVLAVTLGACSTKKAGDANLEDGAYAAGLGEQTGFEGKGPNDITYTTQAPHNQLYFFEYDNNTVRQDYIPSIRAQANYLRQNPGARILLAGHTDDRGSREYNIGLGERRARSVLEIMRLAGISPDQVRIVSYGKERPAAMGNDEAAWVRNRRVELIYEANK